MKDCTFLLAILTVLLAMITSGNAQASGSFTVWGWDEYGQCSSPASETVFEAISSGDAYNLGLNTDGSIVAWGYNVFGQCDVPEPNTGFVAVAAGDSHGLGLKRNGSVVAWGYNSDGQCNVPEPLEAVALAFATEPAKTSMRSVGISPGRSASRASTWAASKTIGMSGI